MQLASWVAAYGPQQQSKDTSAKRAEERWGWWAAGHAPCHALGAPLARAWSMARLLVPTEVHAIIR